MDHPPVHKYLSNQLLPEEDAKKFYEGAAFIKKKLEVKIINNFEFVSLYILLYLRLAFREKFIVAKLSNRLELETFWKEYFDTLPGHYFENSRGDIVESRFDWIGSMQEYFQFSPSEVEKLYNYCEFGKNEGVLPLVKIFQNCGLNETELNINQFLVNWNLTEYPIQLYFDMPSVQEVHKLQSEGTRCITAFVELDQIQKLYTEDYPPFHTKNCLRFLYHDIQHLVKYIHSELFYEQRGFFKSVNQLLLANNNLLNYSKFDPLMAQDIDHLISDMNCSASQLIGFLKAKWISFYHRQIYPPPCSQLRLNEEEQVRFEDEVWTKAVSLLNITDQSLQHSLRDLCKRKLKSSEKTLINGYFNQVGKTF